MTQEEIAELDAAELEAAAELDVLPPHAVRPTHMASMPATATTAILFLIILDSLSLLKLWYQAIPREAAKSNADSKTMMTFWNT